MITVCNRTETAARIKHSFENARFEGLKELSEPDTLLHIDSTTMNKEQSGIEDGTENELRRIVDT